MFVNGYEAKIVVGIQAKELDEESATYYYDNSLLSRFFTISAPDARATVCVVGFEVVSSWENIEEEIDIIQCAEIIEELQEKFYGITGIRGKVFLMPVVGAS